MKFGMLNDSIEFQFCKPISPGVLGPGNTRGPNLKISLTLLDLDQFFFLVKSIYISESTHKVSRSNNNLEPLNWVWALCAPPPGVLPGSRTLGLIGLRFIQYIFIPCYKWEILLKVTKWETKSLRKSLKAKIQVTESSVVTLLIINILPNS